MIYLKTYSKIVAKDIAKQTNIPLGEVEKILKNLEEP